MENQATATARQYAKTLRAGMTDAERRLWSRLRQEQLGVKFRRQHPFGVYVLDFACLEPKLIVEVDGSQHLDQVKYDESRTAWLMRQGFVVLRFWANEVMSETDAVVGRIVEQLKLAAQAAPTCSAHRGLQAPVAQPARRMRLESPASPPTLPQWGRESIQGNKP